MILYKLVLVVVVVKEWDDEKVVYGFFGNICSGVCGYYI